MTIFYVNINPGINLDKAKFHFKFMHRMVVTKGEQCKYEIKQYDKYCFCRGKVFNRPYLHSLLLHYVIRTKRNTLVQRNSDLSNY